MEKTKIYKKRPGLVHFLKKLLNIESIGKWWWWCLPTYHLPSFHDVSHHECKFFLWLLLRPRCCQSVHNQFDIFRQHDQRFASLRHHLVRTLWKRFQADAEEQTRLGQLLERHDRGAVPPPPGHDQLRQWPKTGEFLFLRHLRPERDQDERPTHHELHCNLQILLSLLDEKSGRGWWWILEPGDHHLVPHLQCGLQLHHGGTTSTGLLLRVIDG